MWNTATFLRAVFLSSWEFFFLSTWNILSRLKWIVKLLFTWGREGGGKIRMVCYRSVKFSSLLWNSFKELWWKYEYKRFLDFSLFSVFEMSNWGNVSGVKVAYLKIFQHVERLNQRFFGKNKGTNVSQWKSGLYLHFFLSLFLMTIL